MLYLYYEDEENSMEVDDSMMITSDIFSAGNKISDSFLLPALKVEGEIQEQPSGGKLPLFFQVMEESMSSIGKGHNKALKKGGLSLKNSSTTAEFKSQDKNLSLELVGLSVLADKASGKADNDIFQVNESGKSDIQTLLAVHDLKENKTVKTVQAKKCGDLKTELGLKELSVVTGDIMMEDDGEEQEGETKVFQAEGDRTGKKEIAHLFKNCGLDEKKAGKGCILGFQKEPADTKDISRGLKLNSPMENEIEKVVLAVKDKPKPSKSGLTNFTKFTTEGKEVKCEKLFQHAKKEEPVVHKIGNRFKAGRFSDRSGVGNQPAVSQTAIPSAGVGETHDAHAMKPRALINQVVEGAGRKPANGSGRVRIELNPPHLGTLDLDIIIRDNKVHVILKTMHNDVRQILQSNVEQLKTSLQNQGLIADNISVSVQERSDSDSYGPGQNGAMCEEGNDRRENEKEDEGKGGSTTRLFSLPDRQERDGQTEGLISLFA